MIRIEIEPLWRFRHSEGGRSLEIMLDFLAEIRATGKITAAADRAKVSYRHAWNLIEKWSEFFDMPLVVHVTPVTGPAHDVLGAVRVILTVPSYHFHNSGCDARTLRRTYGLTEAEARLALRIGTGETPAQAADSERITLESARSRLKTVLAKTGTHRQVELVLLLQRLRSR